MTRTDPQPLPATDAETDTAAGGGRVALLTGGTGFVGSHVAAALAARGWAVHALVRPTSDPARVAPLRSLPGAAVHVHGNGGIDELTRIVGDVRPDVVFHLASLFLVQHAPADVERLVASNILFPAQLVEAMAAHGVRRLVNAGTSWQHYEGRDYDPVNLYAATKQAFEATLAYHVAANGLRAVTLKLFDTYGPDDPRRKVVPLLRNLARSGPDAAPMGMSPGDQLLDLVYVDDAAAAFALAADRLTRGDVAGHETYAVSSGAPVPLREVAAVFAGVVGHPLPIRWGERPHREREVMVPWGGGRPVPGWRPRVSLADGLARLMAIENA